MRLLWRDTRGAVIPMVAITMSALVGVTGLGVEAGLWYVQKRQNQTAADLAAISGARELEAALGYGLTNASAGVYSDICSLAQQDAANNGFPSNVACPSTCANPAPGQVCVNNPPLLGITAGKTAAVEVITNQQRPTLFASLYLPKVTIANRAVAIVAPPTTPACMLVSPDLPYQLTGAPKYKSCNSGFSICLQGSANINAPGCSIVTDSQQPDSIDFTGTGPGTKMNTSPGGLITTAGNVSATGSPNTTPTIQTYAPIVADPYKSTLTHSYLTAAMPTSSACTYTKPSWTGNCVVNGSSINAGDTLSANTQIAGGLTVGGTVNLSPGTYWITNGDLNIKGSSAILECTSCTPGGAGVTIIFTTTQVTKGIVGGISLGPGGGTLNLNAPATGTFSGMVLIQDAWGLPATTTWDNSTEQGSPTETLTGLVYFPASQMDFAGTPSATGPQCLILVVGALAETGNPSLASSGCNSAGLHLLPGTKVTLAE